MSTEKVPPPCWACGRQVAYQMKLQKLHGGGKARARHLCPHGRVCISSRPNVQGFNVAACPECRAAKEATQ